MSIVHFDSEAGVTVFERDFSSFSKKNTSECNLAEVWTLSAAVEEEEEPLSPLTWSVSVQGRWRSSVSLSYIPHKPDTETGLSPASRSDLGPRESASAGSLLCFPGPPPLSYNHDKSHFNIQQPWETEAFEILRALCE